MARMLRAAPLECRGMQNGTDDRPPGAVPPLVAELLDHPDRVAVLSAASARGVLVEVAGAQQRLATWSMLLAVHGRDAEADGEVAAPPPAAPSEQGALTQEEAARAYSMPLRTVRRLTRLGRVPSYTQGRNRMIRP